MLRFHKRLDMFVSKILIQECNNFTIDKETGSNLTTAHLDCPMAQSTISCKHEYRGQCQWWCYQCVIHNLYNYTSWPIYLHNLCVCVAPVILRQTSTQTSWSTNNNHTKWNHYHLIIAADRNVISTSMGSLGAVSIRKTVLPGMAIPMLKIRCPNRCLIFNMEIAIRR